MKKGKKILIISTGLSYNGGSLAVIYAVLELQKRGYNVILTAPDGDDKFINEMMKKGINIMICPTFPHMRKEEIFFVRQFDVVIINTFQMMECVLEAGKIKPVVWWIHEASTLYKSTIMQHDRKIHMSDLDKINVYAVSRIPKNNFNHYFTDKIKETLEYGIPDKGRESISRNKERKLVFAVIGVVCQRKAQDIFVRAIELLDKGERLAAVFKIIGSIGNDDYANGIRTMVSNEPSIEIMGELTQNEMDKIYEEIDIVVCPSREDPLPIVMTEGMMYGKVCITSDANGTVDYIEHKKNGLISKCEDPVNLSKQMKWIIHNRDKLQEIGYHARNTYERYFSMESFGDRLEAAIIETIDRYKLNEQKVGEK